MKLDEEDWEAEIDRMLRSMRRLGFFMLPLLVIAAGMLAFIGMWFNAILLAFSCGYMGFSLGLLTARLKGRS